MLEIQPEMPRVPNTRLLYSCGRVSQNWVSLRLSESDCKGLAATATFQKQMGGQAVWLCGSAWPTAPPSEGSLRGPSPEHRAHTPDPPAPAPPPPPSHPAASLTCVPCVCFPPAARGVRPLSSSQAREQQVAGRRDRTLHLIPKDPGGPALCTPPPFKEEGEGGL